MEEKSLTVTTDIPMRYLIERNAKSQNRLLIYLHGYRDSAEAFLKRAYEPMDFDVLAPNGLFPVPVQTDGKIKEAYSWYFEDHSLNRILIPKQSAITALKNLIKELKLENHKKIIVGFSQGGFLAPKLFEALTNVEKIIGIGCDYRNDLYEKVRNIRVYGIHGVDDKVVDYMKAFDNFQRIRSGAQFASIQGMDHKMNDEAKKKLKEFILV